MTAEGPKGEHADLAAGQPDSAWQVSAEAPRPVTARLVRWLQEPQVIADFAQTEDGRVWTRAQDLIPGAVVREGVPLTAAWGELTWMALPEWDEQDIDTLWLCPLDAPEPPPEALAQHDVRLTVERILSRPQRANVESVVNDLLEDFGASIDVVVQTHRSHRLWARQLLEDLDRVAPAALRALDEQPSAQRLRALARIPPPPEVGGAPPR